MKAIILLVSIAISTLTLAQGTAGIYKIRWFVDKNLTNSFIVNNTNGGFGNTNNSLMIPQQSFDSVLVEIQKIVSEQLHSETQIIYAVNKKGKQIVSGNSMEYVSGLPRATRRQAMKTEYKEYYVKFKIYVGANKGMGLGGNEVASYTRLRPYVRVKMKAYGVDKRCKFRKNARQGGFDTVGSLQFNLGGVSVTNTNALPIQEIVKMTRAGLEKFKAK
jgi:hypothetical protein